jgi:hypothetical protein
MNFILPRLVSIGVLLIALSDQRQPYSFYTALRVILSFTCFWGVVMLWKEYNEVPISEIKRKIWLYIFAIFGFVFNPVSGVANVAILYITARILLILSCQFCVHLCVYFG